MFRVTVCSSSIHFIGKKRANDHEDNNQFKILLLAHNFTRKIRAILYYQEMDWIPMALIW
jgi:transposase-like protein